ncbi:Uncharacterised protein [Candidatus Norongarragalina meridionalis]|nr:Uncharacterised protein [Candidatus Norongarragalina meridionalis]
MIRLKFARFALCLLLSLVFVQLAHAADVNPFASAVSATTLSTGWGSCTPGAQGDIQCGDLAKTHGYICTENTECVPGPNNVCFDWTCKAGSVGSDGKPRDCNTGCGAAGIFYGKCICVYNNIRGPCKVEADTDAATRYPTGKTTADGKEIWTGKCNACGNWLTYTKTAAPVAPPAAAPVASFALYDVSRIEFPNYASEKDSIDVVYATSDTKYGVTEVKDINHLWGGWTVGESLKIDGRVRFSAPVTVRFYFAETSTWAIDETTTGSKTMGYYEAKVTAVEFPAFKNGMSIAQSRWLATSASSLNVKGAPDMGDAVKRIVLVTTSGDAGITDAYFVKNSGKDVPSLDRRVYFTKTAAYAKPVHDFFASNKNLCGAEVKDAAGKSLVKVSMEYDQAAKKILFNAVVGDRKYALYAPIFITPGTFDSYFDAYIMPVLASEAYVEGASANSNAAKWLSTSQNDGALCRLHGAASDFNTNIYGMAGGGKLKLKLAWVTTDSWEKPTITMGTPVKNVDGTIDLPFSTSGTTPFVANFRFYRKPADEATFAECANKVPLPLSEFTFGENAAETGAASFGSGLEYESLVLETQLQPQNSVGTALNYKLVIKPKAGFVAGDYAVDAYSNYEGEKMPASPESSVALRLYDNAKGAPQQYVLEMGKGTITPEGSFKLVGTSPTSMQFDFNGIVSTEVNKLDSEKWLLNVGWLKDSKITEYFKATKCTADSCIVTLSEKECKGGGATAPVTSACTQDSDCPVKGMKCLARAEDGRKICVAVASKARGESCTPLKDEAASFATGSNAAGTVGGGFSECGSDGLREMCLNARKAGGDEPKPICVAPYSIGNSEPNFLPAGTNCYVISSSQPNTNAQYSECYTVSGAKRKCELDSAAKAGDKFYCTGDAPSATASAFKKSETTPPTATMKYYSEAGVSGIQNGFAQVQAFFTGTDRVSDISATVPGTPESGQKPVDVKASLQTESGVPVTTPTENGGTAPAEFDMTFKPTNKGMEATTKFGEPGTRTYLLIKTTLVKSRLRLVFQPMTDEEAVDDFHKWLATQPHVAITPVPSGTTPSEPTNTVPTTNEGVPQPEKTTSIDDAIAHAQSLPSNDAALVEFPKTGGVSASMLEKAVSTLKDAGFTDEKSLQALLDAGSAARPPATIGEDGVATWTQKPAEGATVTIYVVAKDEKRNYGAIKAGTGILPISQKSAIDAASADGVIYSSNSPKRDPDGTLRVDGLFRGASILERNGFETVSVYLKYPLPGGAVLQSSDSDDTKASWPLASTASGNAEIYVVGVDKHGSSKAYLMFRGELPKPETLSIASVHAAIYKIPGMTGLLTPMSVATSGSGSDIKMCFPIIGIEANAPAITPTSGYALYMDYFNRQPKLWVTSSKANQNKFISAVSFMVVNKDPSQWTGCESVIKSDLPLFCNALRCLKEKGYVKIYLPDTSDPNKGGSGAVVLKFKDGKSAPIRVAATADNAMCVQADSYGDAKLVAGASCDCGGVCVT